MATIQPFNHSTIQPFNHSTIQPFNHSTIQPFNHSTIQPFNHSIIQATLPYFYHFYKRSLKNPLLFIIPLFINPIINPFIPSFIPPFINPRRIFQPFDSISPIFKPVGLTELNSIQGEDDGSVRRFESA
ncbi:hypothetical protein [Helicobacter pylori]|uniref:hypothetical protein n=1 Tax=Helicobacter pylori TaxID=210 RepID=UPI0013F48809|nr:hypothetical protein [Helicobacter pylori]